MLGEAEVENLYDSRGSDFDVGGLEVAMDDAFFVGGIQGVGDLRGVLRGDGEGERTLGTGAFDQLHHDIVGADIVNLADVGVVEGGDGSGFPLEAFVETLGGNFDGYVAIEAGVVGSIDFAHAARAEGRKDFVGT